MDENPFLQVFFVTSQYDYLLWHWKAKQMDKKTFMIVPNRNIIQLLRIHSVIALGSNGVPEWFFSTHVYASPFGVMSKTNLAIRS